MAVKQDIIKADHLHITQMLDLVPANFYFDNESKNMLRANIEESDDENEEEALELEQLRKRKDAPNAGTKQEELSSKAKWKRAKFDPSQNKTVSQMSQELSNRQAAAQKETPAQQKLQQKPQQKPQQTPQQTPEQKPQQTPQVLKATPQDSVVDLREKLKQKIEMMKEKRHALDKREEFQKRRLKRNELKAKKKLRQKHDKHEKGTAPPPANAKAAKPKQPTKPVFNKEGKMVFSKFDFCERKEEKKSESKNFKALLEKAQKNKEKIEVLKGTDASAAQNLKQKQQWQNVLQKAEGIKVKDDPELLKKAIKKKEKMKEKSKKAWKERESKVEERIGERQAKRASNIRKKKDGRVKKKIDKQKKKGRLIPGF